MVSLASASPILRTIESRHGPHQSFRSGRSTWVSLDILLAGFVCASLPCWGDGVTERVVWHVVKQCAKKLGFARLAPHDLRRSCAKLCHSAGGELEQIQFLLGHVSVQTTERYLGCKQPIQGAVNDHLGIEP